MQGLAGHRLRRFLASGSPILLAGGVAIIGVMISILSEKNAALITSRTSWALLIIAAAGVILLLLQWRAEYRKRTYDPLWALKFQDDFLSDEMLEMRSWAAGALLKLLDGKSKAERLTNPGIDEVLDFFEDLGFYLQGDQLTPEVAYHAFYYWISRYYLATREYVASARKKNLSQWEFVKPLFDTTTEVDLERRGNKRPEIIDRDEIKRFLREESALAN